MISVTWLAKTPEKRFKLSKMSQAAPILQIAEFDIGD
jgi:hypothetical protein